MTLKKIILASDHAGYHLKDYIKKYLDSLSLENVVEDLGTYSIDSVDYPDVAVLLAKKMENEIESLGVLICGSGIGISIAANRFSHIRAALCCTEEMAILAKEHNNANVLALGSRLIEQEEAVKILNNFLNIKFESGRHLKRVKKLEEIGL
ncbi:MAG: ribose 5-phosphate isomerase B [Alphaproteobacteria bacterium]|jgi:ribose 5-phosphate isomerase B|nr:ribose 5-phosphate isomerase B [Alphaproteobacteria bacterium]